MKKQKLLCVLHRSPPAHGAAKVGDFISNSKKLQENFECKFITIKSSDSIGDIGKLNLKKLYLVVELYTKILWSLIFFRPQKIYFTASIRGVAFYRDLLLCTLWKAYGIFKKVDVYYHYHTKGVNNFISHATTKKILTRFFLKNVNLLLLSPLLEKDFEKVNTYKKVFYLPNGVENSFSEDDFKKYIDKKFESIKSINILYLSNMIKSKGYFEVLKLANLTKKDNAIIFHFAGGWQNDEDEKEFFEYIKKHDLDEKVLFHGFVSGKEKEILLKKASLFVFPTLNDAFPLSILESLSYGVPVVATDEGSIPYILDEKSGIVLKNVNFLPDALSKAKKNLINKESTIYCRERYLNNFILSKFEENLIRILK